MNETTKQYMPTAAMKATSLEPVISTLKTDIHYYKDLEKSPLKHFVPTRNDIEKYLFDKGRVPEVRRFLDFDIILRGDGDEYGRYIRVNMSKNDDPMSTRRVSPEVVSQLIEDLFRTKYYKMVSKEDILDGKAIAMDFAMIDSHLKMIKEF